jgi:hypothetical protein
MSGIANSAGSKSGVIGTTELDYEEGEWTPTIIDGSNATFSGQLYPSSYVKIGRLVTVNFSKTFNNGANTSTLSIGGLPFTSLTYSTGGFTHSMGANDDTKLVRVEAGDVKVRIIYGASTRANAADIDGNWCVFSVSYQST